MMAAHLLKTGSGVSAAYVGWWAFGPDLWFAAGRCKLGRRSRRPLRVARGAARSAARFIPRTLQNTGGLMGRNDGGRRGSYRSRWGAVDSPLADRRRMLQLTQLEAAKRCGTSLRHYQRIEAGAYPWEVAACLTKLSPVV